MRNLPVRADRIADEIDALALITEPGHPYTRRAFTPMFLRGREYLTRRFAEAGLETRIDAAGNLIGRRAGSKSELGTIMLGSHSDTVPDGGRFDGIAGVSAALEVARALKDRDIVLDHDLEIVDFLAEEVSIFGVSCIGSRGMIGLRPTEWLARRSGDVSLWQGIADVGGDPAAPGGRSDIRAFLELHIEQGPILESQKLDVGVVTAIAGITRIEIVVEGRADHAGTTPMGARKDALTAAARIVLGVEQIASNFAKLEHHFAATVGEFSIEPGAANVVPSEARLLIDARAEQRDSMEQFVGEISTLVAEVAAETGVTVRPPLTISDNFPTPCDEDVIRILTQCCEASGARYRRMVSGAGHDAAWMARVTKSAMVFVPCKGGRSHAPEEWAEIDDIAFGAAVLMKTVQRLDTALQKDS